MARTTATAGSTLATGRGAAPAVPAARAWRLSPEAVWGFIFCLPYVAVFAFFVVYPIALRPLARQRSGHLRALFNDPIYYRTVVNTFLLLVVGVNVKMFLALTLSGYLPCSPIDGSSCCSSSSSCRGRCRRSRPSSRRTGCSTGSGG